MGLYNLDKIFKPESVAVIGASEKKESLGRAIMENLVEGGFEGDIIPVNPKHDRVLDRTCYPSLSEADNTPDLAVIATPIQSVPDIIDESARIGVGGAIIISAGGKEMGKEGEKLEEDIQHRAAEGGVRLIGPNCLGIIRPGKNLNASFANQMPLEGKLAFVSQSGAICTAILDLSLQENFGFSHFVSIGSMVDVDFGDLIDYQGHAADVSSILLYVESLTHIRKFMSAARSVSRIKPIVVLKSGKSEAGAKAAASHTGAMAGEDAVYDAAFKRAGIVRVGTIGELFDCAEILSKQPLPENSRLGIITNAGGSGVMAADALAEHSGNIEPLNERTLDKLNEVLPPHWSRNNPIDIIGDATADRYRKTVEICMEADEFDGLLVIFNPQAMSDPAEVARALTELLEKKSYPIFTCWMGGADAAKGQQVLNAASIPTYDTPEQAIRAFMYMHTYSRRLEALTEIPPRLSHSLSFDREAAEPLIQEGLDREGGGLTEVESKKILDAYGVPVNRTEIAGAEDEAVRLAEDMGYPVVMKVHSIDISHKSDADGVQLDLRSESEVRKAYDRIMKGAESYDPEAEVLGVTLQPMFLRPDFEILMGAKKDPNFGPVILFGTGGTLAEVVKDRALGLPPMNRLLARRLMEETRIYPLLKGYRNKPEADRELLEEMIIRLSQLVTDFPQISELDMNPVIVQDGKPVAVDARIKVEAVETESPRHLVISPYPAELESHEKTDEGLPIFVRPIKPEDAPLFEELFNTLSETSIYHRFFNPIKSLSRKMLARFTQLDYDRQIAMVAIDDREDETEKMLGVARIIADPDGKTAEFAVLIGDPWQGQGIGAVLLQRCLDLARERGIRTIWGTVLTENRGMLALGKKLGFEAKPEPGSGEYEMLMEFDR